MILILFWRWGSNGLTGKTNLTLYCIIFQASCGNTYWMIRTRGNQTYDFPSPKNPAVTENLLWTCSSTLEDNIERWHSKERPWAWLQYEYNALILVFFFWMSALYLGRTISEACFLLHWPHAALLVCGVSFPHGSSREKAWRLSRAKCKGSVTSGAVLAGQITDKPPHRERYEILPHLGHRKASAYISTGLCLYL